jgi:hypothetical protein
MLEGGLATKSLHLPRFCKAELSFHPLKTNCLEVCKREQLFTSIPANLVVESGWYVFQRTHKGKAV